MIPDDSMSISIRKCNESGIQKHYHANLILTFNKKRDSMAAILIYNYRPFVKSPL